MSDIQWHLLQDNCTQVGNRFVYKDAYTYNGNHYDLNLEGFKGNPDIEDIQIIWEAAIKQQEVAIKQQSPPTQNHPDPTQLRIEFPESKDVTFKYENKVFRIEIPQNLEGQIKRVQSAAYTVLTLLDTKPPVITSTVNSSTPSDDSTVESEEQLAERIRDRLNAIANNKGEEGEFFEPLKASGGHGGFYRAKVKVNYKIYDLFLKPMDDKVEYNNYKALRVCDKDGKLEPFLPKIYGSVSLPILKKKKKKDIKFMIMENVRVDENGNEWEQLADIKLAGYVEGLPNSIYSKEESRATRDKRKKALTAKGMEAGAENSPGYLIATSSGKSNRMAYYPVSEFYLYEALKKVDLKCIDSLKDQLRNLKQAMEACPVAHIGSSLALLYNQSNGELKIRLIDPAHLIFDETNRGKINKLNGDFYMVPHNHEEYIKRKKSNKIACDNLIESVTRFQGWPKVLDKVKDRVRDRNVSVDEKSMPGLVGKEIRDILSSNKSGLKKDIEKHGPRRFLIDEEGKILNERDGRWNAKITFDPKGDLKPVLKRVKAGFRIAKKFFKNK